MEEKTEKGLIITLIIVGVLIFGVIFTRITFLNFVDNYEFAYKFNTIGGEISPIKEKGYIWSAPFITKIYTIDTRPFQVSIGSNSNNSVHDVINTRVLNAKLVQFNPKGYTQFIAWHGAGDYSADALYPLLMNYAFDPTQKQYPFLTILKQLDNENIFNKDTTFSKGTTVVTTK